jgi:hypothetical protein
MRALEVARIDDLDRVRRHLAHQGSELLTSLGREWHIGVSMKTSVPFSDGVPYEENSARRIP